VKKCTPALFFIDQSGTLLSLGKIDLFKNIAHTGTPCGSSRCVACELHAGRDCRVFRGS
jgi:hypothetical protein